MSFGYPNCEEGVSSSSKTLLKIKLFYSSPSRLSLSEFLILISEKPRFQCNRPRVINRQMAFLNFVRDITGHADSHVA